MLPRREHYGPKSHFAFLADGLADDRERLLTHFAIRSDEVRITLVELVGIGLRDKLIDFEGVLAFQRDGLKLFVTEFDVVALPDLIALDDL